MTKPGQQEIYKGYEIEHEEHAAPWNISGEPLWYAIGRKEFRKDHFIAISVECYATKNRAKVSLRHEIDMRETAIHGLPKKQKRSLRPSRRKTE